MGWIQSLAIICLGIAHIFHVLSSRRQFDRLLDVYFRRCNAMERQIERLTMDQQELRKEQV